MNATSNYQVVICGGGLAGLTLALQLRKGHPEINITVIEKTVRPLDEAAHKVGESTVEIGAHYLSSVLGLKKYLEEKQLPKLGLRYFYGDTTKPFETRPELGPSMFSPVPTYQLDRGILENDLREMVVNAGVELLEGVSLKDISIEDGGELNTVTYVQNEEEKSIRANWVVDAMGRRRYLQTKLGLKKESPHSASSVWFRMEGKVTVDDLVSKSNTNWHDRNIEDRFYSTNHLMGLGYWVWLIPLSSGNTSIGIVTQNDLHDFAAYSRNYETSFEWLENHEPHLANHLKGKEPLDFRKIKNYSYGSEQLFSENGWSCVGEAGIFSDPFYSPGSDMIAITNTFTSNLIREDINGKLSSEKVDQLNDFILENMFPDQLNYYVEGYHTFGNTQIAASKFLWDTLYYWRIYAHAFITGVYADFEKLKTFEKHVKQFAELNRGMQKRFKELADSTPSQDHFEHIDLARKEMFIESAISLLTKPSDANYETHLQKQFQFLSELQKSLEAELKNSKTERTPFADFFGQLSGKAKLQNRYNRLVSRIGNGTFLYAVRDVYVDAIVRGKQR
ncbi:MAG: NAD(P)/FAD-dependent oxidoreductase, partial [Flavobacteriales bacterium]|nr:NAD(P)/FAD-dependent oxidoreductase [Flavobacteriales bacterium]